VAKLNSGAAQFPDLRAGRNCLERPRSGVPGHERQWEAATLENDQYLARNRPGDGSLKRASMRRVARRYLLTGRHGLFNCYEAFIHIVDSMFNSSEMAESDGGAAVASRSHLSLPAEFHVWRQDHNGFTIRIRVHRSCSQQEGGDRARVSAAGRELPALRDGSLLRSRHYVNVVIAGQAPRAQWLSMDAAVKHCSEASGSGSGEQRPTERSDVVMACAGDVPTLETLAACPSCESTCPR